MTQGPREVIEDDHDDIEERLTEQHVTDIAEIFRTPLTGAYNWDYTVADNRIKRLYELGKELNWNASIDVDWTPPLPEGTKVAEEHPGHPYWADYPEYMKLSNEDKLRFFQHRHAWSLAQFLHGEQGALLVASQLVACAPTFNAKLYAASQTFDEARHVEVFNRYIRERVKTRYPVNNGLKSILDKILTDERWDLKFIGMQIVIEGLALAAFNTAKNTTNDPVFRQLLEYVIRDEARHVTFGVNYLEEFVQTLSQDEIEDRAEFAYQACLISRERLISTEVYEYFGFDVEAARKYAIERNMNGDFMSLLFARVVPNLKRIGLLTDRIREKFDDMGVLWLEDHPTDADVDWAELEAPLERTIND